MSSERAHHVRGHHWFSSTMPEGAKSSTSHAVPDEGAHVCLYRMSMCVCVCVGGCVCVDVCVCVLCVGVC